MRRPGALLIKVHRTTIRKAIGYIHKSQRPDGSWFGSWGVCFTYATMFALESLALNGETFESSERVRRACRFIIGKQMADGGWGENYMVSLENMEDLPSADWHLRHA